ncbi:MAG: LAGLIDADG family homing endonuclease [Patescibacteria group bacterium]|nr:LAGLIDADG family homing endonuclease [Patescibacteria group bacterium]
MSDNASSAGNQQERLVEFTPDYVVGLIDGEGYFSVTVSRDFSKTYKSLRMRLIFGVKLKEDDGEILHRLKQFFNCGSLHRRIDERPTFSNCLEYQVRRYEDIKTTIIPFFRKHPLLFKSKRHAFERFVELAACFEAGEHLSDQGFEKMKVLAREVHQ